VARIAGVNIPTNKRVRIALQYIHGIGQKNAKDIVEKVNIPADRRVSQLTDAAEWKRRQYPPGPKISLKAFGRDRRLPITNRWREHGPRG